MNFFKKHCTSILDYEYRCEVLRLHQLRIIFLFCAHFQTFGTTSLDQKSKHTDSLDTYFYTIIIFEGTSFM